MAENVEEAQYDVIVLGGGPGGYPAAIKAAQAGKKVALIEYQEMGGTCLNRGCIPTKTLIANADALRKIQSAEAFGITVGEVSFDYSKMVSRKDETIGKIRKGLESLIESNKIVRYNGYGKFLSPDEIKVIGQDNALLRSEKIIIATGSEPREIDAFRTDGKRIHDSTSILQLKTLPESIAIIGGGYIGCEFASMYHNLGVKVTILEALPTILSRNCQSVINFMTKAFKKRKVDIRTNVFVEGIQYTDHGINVQLSGHNSLEADCALVAVGRVRNSSGIGLEKTGVVVKEDGEIPTNERMETNVPGIYAVGDVTTNWWLAHVASHQGLVAAANAVGEPMQMHYNAVPAVIFTEPEIATVGLTLEEALNAGYAATVGTFPFEVLGKSQAALHMEGFAQLVTEKNTGQILGAQVIGYEASTLVAEMAVAIANELTVEALTETIHAHPTIAEAWLEAALVANETPLHLPPKRQRDKAT